MQNVNTENLIASQIEHLKNNLIEQSSLVIHCFAGEVFSYDDLHNGWQTNEEGEEEENEVAHWYAFADSSDFVIEALARSSMAYIHNEHGLWVGRADSGSAWDMYFLPELASVLYYN